MSARNDGGPAFPLIARDHVESMGMSLRDYFAAQALNSLCLDYCESARSAGYDEGWMQGLATDAYAMADAMLKAREA